MGYKFNIRREIMSVIIPYGKRVTVEREEAKTKTEGGLFIPESVSDKEKPRKGTVLAVGDPVTDIKVGDVVVFGKYSGLEVDDVLILKQEDIQGICK
jgi:chaperonin GroES